MLILATIADIRRRTRVCQRVSDDLCPGMTLNSPWLGVVVELTASHVEVAGSIPALGCRNWRNFHGGFIRQGILEILVQWKYHP